MVELIFVIFLLSGLLKSFLLFFSINLFSIDITLLTSLILVGVFAVDAYKRAYLRNRFYLPQCSRSIVSVMMIFYLWLIVTLSYTVSPRYSLVKVLLFLTNIIALLFPFVYRNFQGRRFFHIFAYGGSALVFVYSILLPNIYDSYMRSAINKEFVVKYLDVGFIAGLVVLIVLFMCRQMPRFIKVLLAGFNLYAILISSARAPLIFLLLVLFIRFVVSGFRFIKNKTARMNLFKGKNLVYVGAGLATLIVSAFYLIEKYAALLERSLGRLSQVTDTSSASVSERVFEISFSFQKIMEHFSHMIFGMGIGSFGILYQGTDERLYPHNVLLEIGFETGLIGVLIFLFLLILYLRQLRFNLNYVLIFAYLILNNLKSYSMIDLRIMFGVLSVLVIHDKFWEIQEPPADRAKGKPYKQ